MQSKSQNASENFSFIIYDNISTHTILINCVDVFHFCRKSAKATKVFKDSKSSKASMPEGEISMKGSKAEKGSLSMSSRKGTSSKGKGSSMSM